MRVFMKILATMAIVAAIVLFSHWTFFHRVDGVTAESDQESPVLIPGIDEPAEMRVKPMPIFVPTPQERMLGEAIRATAKSGFDALGPAVERIITRYPSYPDAYVLRLGTLCKGSDRAAIITTVNKALKYIGNSRIAIGSTLALYSMRAKIEHDNGDDQRALDDLDETIHANVTEALNFANSGATAPEKNVSACTWTEPDLDELVRKFPNDYRAYMLQGLYYSFFATFKSETLNLSTKAFDKAANLNNQSALPTFFSTQAVSRAYTFKRISMSQPQRDGLDRMIVQGMTKALAIDPNLLPALGERAQAYLELKKYPEAIADYDKTLSLNPKDETAYNDRALAEIDTGDIYAAISDFGKSIEYKKRELQHSSSYEGRAEAYMDTHQWDRAAVDLDTAVSLQIGGIMLLSNIQQFRALYPEYKAASDEAIAHKLRDTFYPNMEYSDFAQSFLHDNVSKGFLGSTVIPDLYVKRSDVYLKAGKWRKAAVDFRRAINGFPQYASAIERWHEIGSSENEHTFIDMKTLNDTHPESALFWIKQSQGALDASVPYSVEQYEVNCTAQQIRSLSSVNYNASGNVIGASERSKWESVVPDSLAETLFSGICRSSSPVGH